MEVKGGGRSAAEARSGYAWRGRVPRAAVVRILDRPGPYFFALVRRRVPHHPAVSVPAPARPGMVAAAALINILGR